MSNILISAAHKYYGKTTIIIGLSFKHLKKGPDCHNLDFYTMTSEEIQHCVSRYSQTANLCIILMCQLLAQLKIQTIAQAIEEQV